jgi:hypothetical protein
LGSLKNDSHKSTIIMEVHPIEREWRRFRSSGKGELLRKSFGLIPKYLREMGLVQISPEVVLPAAIPYGLLKAEEVMRRGVQLLYGPLNSEDDLLANSIHVWAAYRESKAIYRIEPSLAEYLKHSPWPSRIPVEAFRLPGRCIILEIPGSSGPNYIAAVCDLVAGAEVTGILELGLNKYCQPSPKDSDTPDPTHHKWVPKCVLRLDEPDLAISLERTRQTAGAQGGTIPETAILRHQEIALALRSLLYLAGEPDLVRQVHSGMKPAIKDKLRHRDPERFKDLEEPKINTVGASFARSIEH